MRTQPTVASPDYPRSALLALMRRLKTRPQFQAAMAGGTVSRTPHFALHRLGLVPTGGETLKPTAAVSAVQDGSGSVPREQHAAQALFAVTANESNGPWLGAMVPKKWARRAVTRNAIKRQIYAAGMVFEEQLPVAAHVVRLRSTFDRKQFPSATSEALKIAVREELEQLFAYAVRQQKSKDKPKGSKDSAGSASSKDFKHSKEPKESSS